MVKLLSLHLKNFRNYNEAHLQFSPDVNTFTGENGQGKTNLLEALSLLMTGRSFRKAPLTELVQFGQKGFHLEALFEKEGVEQQLKISGIGKERWVTHNATALSTLSSLLGILPGVVLSPQDSLLVKGPPLGRRQFLDLLIARVDPSYLSCLTRYNEALKMRNALLRNQQLTAIESPEEIMANEAPLLIAKRKKQVQKLASQCTLLEEKLSCGRDTLTLFYESKCTTKEEFQNMYNELRTRDLENGCTSIGPHRDELTLLLHGKEARSFASEGQQRTAATALKLAEWLTLKEEIGTSPLLCFDDIGLSLDGIREKELFTLLTHQSQQVFLTTPRTDLSSFPLGKIFQIADGYVN